MIFATRFFGAGSPPFMLQFGQVLTKLTKINEKLELSNNELVLCCFWKMRKLACVVGTMCSAQLNEVLAA